MVAVDMSSDEVLIGTLGVVVSWLIGVLMAAFVLIATETGPLEWEDQREPVSGNEIRCLIYDGGPVGCWLAGEEPVLQFDGLD